MWIKQFKQRSKILYNIEVKYQSTEKKYFQEWKDETKYIGILCQNPSSYQYQKYQNTMPPNILQNLWVRYISDVQINQNGYLTCFLFSFTDFTAHFLSILKLIYSRIFSWKSHNMKIIWFLWDLIIFRVVQLTMSHPKCLY